MTVFKVGTADYPEHRARYLSEFALVELRVGFVTPPSERVLRKWATEARAERPDFEHVWVAWHAFTHEPRDLRGGVKLALQDGESLENLGHFKNTPENARVWQQVLAQAAAVEAKLILLETPASLAPSTQNKQRMRDFQARRVLAAEPQRLAWHPAGFWDREEANALADELGWLLVVDPLVDEDEPLPTGPTAYFQMLGRHGLADRYGDEDLERLVELAAPYDQVIVTFRTEEPLRDAKRFSRACGLIG